MPYKDAEQRKEYGRQHYLTNKAQIREKAKLKYKTNKEEIIRQTTEWANRNKDKVRTASRKSKLKKYGLTPDSFNTMIEAQFHRCKICGVVFDELSRTCVDHCHSTGKVRGILCFHCNTALGHFRDSIETLYAAIDYLENSDEESNT